MRTVLQCNRPSKSATALASQMQIKRLKRTNSKFRAKPTDVIVNWGIVTELPGANYVNSPSAVLVAANKLATLDTLVAAGIRVPYYSTTLPTSDQLYLARTTLHGHSGEGIVIGKPSELPSAPLYVKLIEQRTEYRAIVCAGQVVDFKEKRRKRPQSDDNPDGFDGEYNDIVRNLSGGYIFARQNLAKPEGLDELAINTMDAIGLTYGAIDIIEDHSGNLFVLEVNTRFGLENTTVTLFGEALQGHINETY